MNKMNKNKTLVVLASLMLAMGMMSFAYAHWYEYLYIDVVVNTGEVDVGWSLEGCYDSEPPEKDVSGVSAVLVDTDLDGDFDLMEVTVKNAYPCIWYYVNFNVENTGTIPVHFEPLELTVPDVPMEVYIEPEILPQLHPGEVVFGQLAIHLLQDAEELTTYRFGVKLTAYEWSADIVVT